MMQSGDLQLHHVRQEISRQVSFPEELSNSINESAARSLLDDLAACKTKEERLRFTYGLSRKRLNDLFGAALIISVASDEEAFNHVLDIFRHRATLSLTQTAWAFYQRHYPSDRMGRVLSTLVSAVEDKNEKAPFLNDLKQVTIDHLLPRRLAERLAHDPEALARARLPFQEDSAEIPDPAMLADTIPVDRMREKYPLVAAYTTLNSLPGQTISSTGSIGTGLCGYLIRLSILPETPFAAAFLVAYFQNAPDMELFLNADLFLQALRISRKTSQMALLHRYLDDYRMAPRWDTINLGILDQFGIPDCSTDTIPDEDKSPNPESSDNPVKQETAQSLESASHEARSSQTVSDQAEPENPDEKEQKEQKSGLLGWIRRKKKETAQDEKNREPENKTLSQTSPKEEGTAAKPPVTDASEDSKIDTETKLAELEQTLIENIQEMSTDHEDTTTGRHIWSMVHPECAIRFRQWAFMHQINQHHESSERKMMFFRKYALSIRAVHVWDEETLLIDLRDFYIADHRDEPDKVWYYDRNTIQILAETQGDKPKLNQPEQPFITARNAMLQDMVSNIVCVELDDVHILYAHDYIRRIKETAEQKRKTKGIF